MLTTSRRRALVVQPSELSALVDYALDQRSLSRQRDLADRVHSELTEWVAFQTAMIGRRKPDELRVIYLCGPEPMNDLEVLLSLGVNPHNVWAIESNEHIFRDALESISKAGIPVKLHRGSLKEFFERVHETFDVAYLDTTGPMLTGRPNSLAPVLELLRGSRLAPLSVLITNFAEVPDTEQERYARVMTDFFRFRYNEVPAALHRAGVDPSIARHDAEHMLAVVRSKLEPVYSDFITRMLIDLARDWIPAARGFRVLEKQYLSSDKLTAIESAFSTEAKGSTVSEILANISSVYLSPETYPWVSFLRSMRESAAGEPLIQQLGNMLFDGRSAEDLNKSVSLLDNITEGHWQLANKDLLRAIAAPWFDHELRFSCDIPFPHLIVRSLLGTYGYPAFASLRASLRGSYVAKSTRMFTDLLVLDRCRYYFDWFPPAAQVPARFRSHAFQVLARCLMDRIWSSDAHSDSHPFKGSSVAGFSALEAAPFPGLKKRARWR